MKPPTKSQQRYFGIAVASALFMLSWITWRAFASATVSSLLICCAIGFAAAYHLVPSSQPRLIAGFRAITFPIQWVMTCLVLAIVYYGVLTPIAIWYRSRGKSIRDGTPGAPGATSNWRPIDSVSDPDSFFRTF